MRWQSRFEECAVFSLEFVNRNRSVVAPFRQVDTACCSRDDCTFSIMVELNALTRCKPVNHIGSLRRRAFDRVAVRTIIAVTVDT